MLLFIYFSFMLSGAINKDARTHVIYLFIIAPQETCLCKVINDFNIRTQTFEQIRKYELIII